MARALFNGKVIAESNDIQLVEGNAYFPASALDMQYFRTSDVRSVCGWKGTASYFDVVVGDKVSEAAAWYYADPFDTAARIKHHVGFWKGVTVER